MKTAWILATLLLLSGCTPTLLKPVPDPSTPVSTSSVPEEPEAPDSSSDASGAPEEQPEEPSSLPDAQPPASAGSSVKGEPAVELPVPALPMRSSCPHSMCGRRRAMGWSCSPRYSMNRAIGTRIPAVGRADSGPGTFSSCNRAESRRLPTPTARY